MKNLKLLLPLSVALALGACATQPTDYDALPQAREVVQAAEENPAVSRYAPVALREAQNSLQQAEQAARAGADAEEVNHTAYMAMKQANIAQAVAQRELVVRSQQDVDQQRQRVLMQQRERETQQAQREAEQLRRALEDAQDQLSEFEPRQTERGVVLTLDEVLFRFDSAELQAGNVRAIDRLAAYLRAHPGTSILLEGHTDAIGSEQYNQKLSEQRAESVREALVARGIEGDRVRAAGLGEGFPVASNETLAGRSENRRVEVVISQNGMPPTRAEQTTAGQGQQGDREQRARM